MEQLTEMAIELGKGTVPTSQPIWLKEARQVACALTDAAARQ